MPKISIDSIKSENGEFKAACGFNQESRVLCIDGLPLKLNAWKNIRFCSPERKFWTCIKNIDCHICQETERHYVLHLSGLWSYVPLSMSVSKKDDGQGCVPKLLQPRLTSLYVTLFLCRSTFQCNAGRQAKLQCAVSFGLFPFV